MLTYSFKDVKAMVATRAVAEATTREYHSGRFATSESSPTVSPSCTCVEGTLQSAPCACKRKRPKGIPQWAVCHKRELSYYVTLLHLCGGHTAISAMRMQVETTKGRGWC